MSLAQLRTSEKDISVLGLDKHTEHLLDSAGKKTLGDLVSEYDKEDPFDDVDGIGEKKSDQIYECLIAYSIKEASIFGLMKFLFLKNQVLHYLFCPLAICLVLLITPHEKFDRDEWLTVMGVFFSMLFYDMGRWARDPVSEPSEFTSGRLRIIVVLLSFAVTRFLVNETFGASESVRVIYVTSLCCAWALLRAAYREKEYRKMPRPSVVPRNGNAPDDAEKNRLAEWWKSQRLPIQEIIAGGVITILSSVIGYLLKIISGLINADVKPS